MSSALGIIGIILAVAFLIYFAYKGINVILLGVISCLIIMVFNGMPVIKSVNKVMLPGVCTYITAMAGPTLMGCLIAAFYETSGAARSVADALYRLFTISARRRQRESGGSEPVMLSPLLSILIVYAIGVTLSYGGLNPVVILFILMPVASDVFEKSGIPRSMLPGIVLGALATASCSMPGTTSDQNIIASQFLHTSAMAAPIPGFIGGAFVLALNITVMNYLAKKEIARGHLYTPQQRELKMTDDSRKPHWLISIIPMTSTIIGYNAFKWNILAALALNVVLCLVLFWRYLGGLNGFVKLLEPVPMQFAQLVLQVGILGSIGAVASASPAFPVLTHGLLHSSFPGLYKVVIVISIITGVGGSGPAGLTASLPYMKQTFAQMGISMNALHRVAVFSSQTLDTLPTNPGYIISTGIAEVSIKESYKYVFISTVLNTAITAFLVATLLTIFPGWA